MTANLDIEEVKHALTVSRVVEWYQLPTKRGGAHELESSSCPRRPDHPRRAFTINTATGRWRCFPCAISGDLLRLVAEFERLSDRTDFPAVLARAAEIAGVTPSDLPEEERRRRRDAWRKERQAIELAEQEARLQAERAAVPKATRYWQGLLTEHERGLEYLAERGLYDAADLVRYDRYYVGSPAIPLYTSGGQIRNVVRRCLPELGEPKTPGLKDCPTAGTLLGAVGDISSRRPAVATEGVADTITAALAWRGATVLGAHAACNLVDLVKVVATRCVAMATPLYLVPHNDRAGKEAAVEAGRLAVKAGLSPSAGSLVIVKHGEKDLNDAWRRGWRPTAV